MDIITIIGSACLTFLLTVAQPVRDILTFLDLIPESSNPIKRYVGTMLSCCLCLSFWITLILTGNVLHASIGSILSESIARKMNEIKL